MNTTDIGQYDLNKEVDWAEGLVMLVRIKTIENVGLLDSKYFAYWGRVGLVFTGKVRMAVMVCSRGKNMA